MANVFDAAAAIEQASLFTARVRAEADRWGGDDGGGGSLLTSVDSTQATCIMCGMARLTKIAAGCRQATRWR